jgi:hypothetical protein
MNIFRIFRKNFTIWKERPLYGLIANTFDIKLKAAYGRH